MNINGLTASEWKLYEDLLIKANDEQVLKMYWMNQAEALKRLRA